MPPGGLAGRMRTRCRCFRAAQRSSGRPAATAIFGRRRPAAGPGFRARVWRPPYLLHPIATATPATSPSGNLFITRTKRRGRIHEHHWQYQDVRNGAAICYTKFSSAMEHWRRCLQIRPATKDLGQLQGHGQVEHELGGDPATTCVQFDQVSQAEQGSPCCCCLIFWGGERTSRLRWWVIAVGRRCSHAMAYGLDGRRHGPALKRGLNLQNHKKQK
ncbi:uncharacterized protein LOC124668702 [Lolium rigidum]|uniref:uncharacterized protein LOC124668702 n=1 Tax=Lolium rigidum TaxID=89674 RepID=UPI001F5E2EBC|nr:uncharacterized protein LOC124668702 [Lolium rigidum]